MRVRCAFTLIELLVVLAIMTVLIGLLLPALLGARETARATQCLSKMRQIGMAVQLYAQDHQDLFPRSTHSALVYSQKPWGYALSPYLGHQVYIGPGPDWDRLFQTHYRCPADTRKDRWSYGKSVWFELTAGETGEIEGLATGPTYPRLASVPNPSVTVMFGELGSGSMADHIMAHFWYMGGYPEVDRKRHGAISNYVFVDGHGAGHRFEWTFDLSNNKDLWHPGRAR